MPQVVHTRISRKVGKSETRICADFGKKTTATFPTEIESEQSQVKSVVSFDLRRPEELLNVVGPTWSTTFLKVKLTEEIFRYRRDTTIGIGVLNTNKVAHFKEGIIFYFV